MNERLQYYLFIITVLSELNPSSTTNTLSTKQKILTDSKKEKLKPKKTLLKTYLHINLTFLMNIKKNASLFPFFNVQVKV
jgi:hypothetical protein